MILDRHGPAEGGFERVGVIGVIVTASAVWLVGIAYGLQTIRRNVKRTLRLVGSFPPGTKPMSRDWSDAVFALFMLLVWLGMGFLVMSQVKT